VKVGTRFMRYACGETDIQTDRHTHHNTPHHWGRVISMWRSMVHAAMLHTGLEHVTLASSPPLTCTPSHSHTGSVAILTIYTGRKAAFLVLRDDW